jgi:hypothetical protein
MRRLEAFGGPGFELASRMTHPGGLSGLPPQRRIGSLRALLTHAGENTTLRLRALFKRRKNP